MENGVGRVTIVETARAGEVMQPTLDPSQVSSAYDRTKIRRVLAWFVVGLWMAFIFYWSAQSSLPGFKQSLPDLLLKKGGHLVVFGVLALLAYRAVRHDAGHVRALVGAGVLAAGYGALDEFHQGFVAGRTAAALDVLIDAAGATAALAAVHLRYDKTFSTPRGGGAQQQLHPKGSEFDGIG